jgi:hypothetical protein
MSPFQNIKTLRVSVDFLFCDDKDALSFYQELVMYPKGLAIPETAVVTLWTYTGFLKKVTQKLLTKQKDKSLLQIDGEAPNNLISHKTYNLIIYRQQQMICLACKVS